MLRTCTNGISSIRKVREGFFENMALELRTAGRVVGQQLREECPIPQEQHAEDPVAEGAW